MKRIYVVVIGVSLLLPASMLAADSKPAGWGSIIQDATIRPGDSPLVRAAKEAAAWRQQLKVHASSVIDNYTLRTTGEGHFAQANATDNSIPAVYPSTAQAAPPPEGLSPKDRAQMQRKLQQLNLEHGVMGEEADNPWSDQIDEDMVTKQMNQLPGQINQLQTQLGTSASPTYQPMSSPAPVGSSLPPAQASNPTPTSASSPPPL